MFSRLHETGFLSQKDKNKTAFHSIIAERGLFVKRVFLSYANETGQNVLKWLPLRPSVKKRLERSADRDKRKIKISLPLKMAKAHAEAI